MFDIKRKKYLEPCEAGERPFIERPAISKLSLVFDIYVLGYDGGDSKEATNEKLRISSKSPANE